MQEHFLQLSTVAKVPGSWKRLQSEGDGDVPWPLCKI